MDDVLQRIAACVLCATLFCFATLKTLGALQQSGYANKTFLKWLKRLPGMNGIGEFMKNYIGSRDYKAASPMMRKILVNVVEEDLSEDAKKIKVPTLLIWGTYDTEAPIEEARRLETILQDGALIELNGSHYAYIENLDRVVEILNHFF